MSTDTTTRPVDEARLEAFLGQVVTDSGAALNGVLVMLGGELGLWVALRDAGPLSISEIAGRSGARERYVRELNLGAGSQRLPRVRPGGGDVRAAPRSKRWHSPTRTAPSTCSAPTTCLQGPAEDRGALPFRGRLRLTRA